jgi:tetratricopeptide (TPR) repeat protein
MIIEQYFYVIEVRMPQLYHIFKKAHFHTLIQQFRFSFAKFILEALIKRFPNEAQYYEFMLVIASMEHNPEELVELHKTISDKFPGTALEFLAKGLYPGVKINLARDFLHAATRLDPDNAYMSYFLSSTYLNLSDYNKSLEYADVCLKLDPSFYLALLLRMTCHKKLGNFNEFLSDAFSALCYIENLNGLYIVESIIDELNKHKTAHKKILVPPSGVLPEMPTF